METRKVGRKPLNLTPEEWKIRREKQRLARIRKKDIQNKRDLVFAMVSESDMDFDMDTVFHLADLIAENDSIQIKQKAC